MQRLADPICVLASGGVDSSVLMAELVKEGHQVVPLYIRSGFVWERAERFWLQSFLHAIDHGLRKRLVVAGAPLDDVYPRHWSLTGEHVPSARSSDEAVYLPGRNLTFFSKAAVFCALHRVPTLAIATLKENPFADNTRLFLLGMEETIHRGLDWRLAIVRPYAPLSKPVVIRRGRKLPLDLTFSCLAPVRDRHCGRCNKCAERQRAFHAAGVVDPTQYAR